MTTPNTDNTKKALFEDMKNPTQWKISNGPSTAGLKRAWADAFGENDASTRFELEANGPFTTAFSSVSVKVTRIEYESGCGHSFNFGGYITSDSSLDKLVGRNVKGHYSGKSRSGGLTLV